MKREVAWRVFASEYNDSTVEIKGEGEKSPSYIVTPLGAMINRLFIIGVLTDVDTVSEGGDFIRAHVSDPTGVFSLYSGQFQPEATAALTNIEVPAFVAVTGKSRTFSPEEGTLYVSVTPEQVVEVDADIRDQWILETCKLTKERIEAILEAKKMNPSNAYDLRKLGYSRNLSKGVILSVKKYDTVDVEKYLTLIRESLQYLTPPKDTLPDLHIEEQKIEEKPEETMVKAGGKEFEESEKTVLKIIKQIGGEDGAPWDSITEKCEKAGLSKDTIEEALTSLMDKGLIYEPILGTIKTT
jgi:hypothetical protein